MTKLLIATHNKHKVQEIRAILGDDFQCLTLDDFSDAPKIVEDAPSFEGNAAKKSTGLAKWICGKLNLDFVLADDSGLETDALNGAPGVHSARFAALDSGTHGNSSDAENNSKLLRLLDKIPAEKRGAQFHCTIALTPVPMEKIESNSPVCFADAFETEIFDGICRGKIIFAPRGKNGFGYDPLFVPEGFEQTFAELGDEVKNKISHRARALEKLKRHFTIG